MVSSDLRDHPSCHHAFPLIIEFFHPGPSSHCGFWCFLLY
jgi:hypothetical protein